jgi:hypothetical protein
MYKKGLIDNKLKEKLLDKKDSAIQRAKDLMRYENPSSTVFKLVEILNEITKNQ